MPEPANNFIDIVNLRGPEDLRRPTPATHHRGDEDRSAEEEAVPEAKDTVELPKEAEVPAAASLSEDIVVAGMGECEPEEPKQGPPPDNEFDPLLVAVANREDPNLRLSGKRYPLPPCATNERRWSTKHPLNPLIISFILIVFHYPPMLIISLTLIIFGAVRRYAGPTNQHTLGGCGAIDRLF